MKYGIVILRKFLSKKETYGNHYGDAIVRSGHIVQRLINLLNFPEVCVQYEIAWLLINLTVYSADTSQILTTNENLSFLYECLIISDKAITPVLLWLFGNMIIEKPEIKTFLIENQIFEYLAEKMSNLVVNKLVNEKTTWLVSNFLKGQKFNLCQINVKNIIILDKSFSRAFNRIPQVYR
jgi:hypothetical protein